MKLSIVTTFYCSSPYIDEFYERISQEANKITDDYELIFVDDGSPDDSLQKAISLHEKDNKVKVVELSRNFGHHKAIMTGLSFAKGDYIFLIDSDLEEEPELLGKFWAEMQKDDTIDVVYGVQEKRKGGWFEKVSGTYFWKIFNLLSSTKIQNNPLTIRLMKKNYVRALISFKEKELFLAGIFELVGFNQIPISIEKKIKGITSYNLIKKIRLLSNAIASFSAFPLLISFYLGLLVSLFSLFYGFYLIFNKLFFNAIILGWTSLMVSIWFLSGLLLLSIGITGLYISKIYSELKNRPVIIKRIL